MKYRTNRQLGQHFLLNPSVVKKIVDLAGVTPTDRLLEIGPGPGIMTGMLAERGGELVAVEKDRRFAASLQEKFAENNRVRIVEADFLVLDLEKLLEQPRWKVVANLPYNIATEVVFHLIDKSYLFGSFYLMVQKEVADRLCAAPGSKDYSLLSIFSQLLSRNKKLLTLPPGAFTPPPKVRSTLVEFRIQDHLLYDIHHLPTFEAVVQAAFQQRRKMIRNSLKQGLTGHTDEEIGRALAASGIDETTRPEDVAISAYTTLANRLYMDKQKEMV